MTSWLVIDVSYLCYRAFHTSMHLSFKGRPTTVVFQFLKSISAFKDQFQTDNVAFCFEHKHLYRRDLFKGYKAKRNHPERSPEETQSIQALATQINQLRTSYLPRIGFKNILCEKGMESDDLMAAIAKNLPPDEDAILITADKDLYQCLRSNVSMFSPQSNKMITEESFIRDYGIKPPKWAVVKALAGCNSDCVPGIVGIGETTALKYLCGQLKWDSTAYKKINTAEAREIVKFNRRLVQLPFVDCPVPQLVEDEIEPKGWRSVCAELGMRSIASHPPVAVRKRAQLNLEIK